MQIRYKATGKYNTLKTNNGLEDGMACNEKYTLLAP